VACAASGVKLWFSSHAGSKGVCLYFICSNVGDVERHCGVGQGSKRPACYQPTVATLLSCKFFRLLKPKILGRFTYALFWQWGPHTSHFSEGATCVWPGPPRMYCMCMLPGSSIGIQPLIILSSRKLFSTVRNQAARPKAHHAVDPS